jgi:hypothetical protein
MLTACSQEPAEESSQVKGYPVPQAHASAYLVLTKTGQPTLGVIQNYMNSTFPRWGDRPQTDDQLAAAILKVAKDFDIDARLLTALISHESGFDARAVSPTGAVGLTQLTTIGIEEFIDQSGAIYEEINGQKNVTNAGSGIEYFKSAILKSWPKFPVGKKLKDISARTQWAKQTKEAVFSRPDQYVAQIIAGATLLKAAIAFSCLKDSICTAEKLGTNTEEMAALRRDIVRRGLERYNGDDTVMKDGQITKVYYAKDILRRFDEI